MNPLSEQDVRDFISKLSTESTKVLLVFFNTALGISLSLPGLVTLQEARSLTVYMGGPGFTNSATFTISLDALLAAKPGYADARELFNRGVSAPPGFEREAPVEFTLGFTFSNGFILVFTALRES